MSDPFLIPALISGGMSALGSIGQGLLNSFNTTKTNDSQIELANTAVQRRMKDLKVAGINPLLAGVQGGAQTPTLQAPHMTGIDTAMNEISPVSIQSKSNQLNQQAMNIAQTTAETARLNAERDKIKNEADYTATQNSWFGKTAQQAMDLQGAQQLKAEAETKTLEVLRAPQTEKMRSEIAQIAAETSRTKTDNEILQIQKKYADQKYGADASKAMTEASKLATDYKEFFLSEKNQTVKKQALELQILTSELGQKLIEQSLAVKYGEPKYLSSMNDNIFKILTNKAYVDSKWAGNQSMNLSGYGPEGRYVK